MEPLRQTREAMAELTLSADDDLLASMVRSARRVRALVPSCVAMSLSVAGDGLTFTVRTAAATGAPYGVDLAPSTPDDDRSSVDPLDEVAWLRLAGAGAAPGVRSTLMLPVVTNGRAVASVHLYAAADGAFDGLHDAVAQACGGWRPGAVTNADLCFDTRDSAALAPEVLRRQMVVNQAVGILAARYAVPVDAATTKLRDLARDGGVDETEAAERVVRSVPVDTDS